MIGLAAALSEAGIAGAVIVESAEAAVSVIERLRAIEGDFALLVIGDAVSPLDRAMLVAGIAVLAIALAPARRIGAVVIEAGAEVQHIIAAASFLKNAKSTTGQMLTVAPRP